MKKAVFEELNGDMAVFIVDDVKKPYHITVSKLAEDVKLGDVFEVELADDESLKLGTKLPEERKRREDSSRAKREKLLKRKKES